MRRDYEQHKTKGFKLVGNEHSFQFLKWDYGRWPKYSNFIEVKLLIGL